RHAALVDRRGGRGARQGRPRAPPSRRGPRPRNGGRWGRAGLRVKTAFMGTAAFAVPCLRILREQGHEVQTVVTQPDRPAGRGQTTHASPVKALAVEWGLPVLQPEKASQPEFVDA